MSVHALRVEPPYFDALLDGTKTFEVRKNDRGFQTGDTLDLREYQPACVTPYIAARYTGRALRAHVSYMYSGDPRWPALQPGYVVLGLSFAAPSGVVS